MEEKLLSLEKKLDEAVLKHRLLIEENHCHRIKCKKTLRFFIEPSVIKTRVINDLLNNLKMHGSDLIKRIFLTENGIITKEFLCDENKLDNFYLSDRKIDFVHKSTVNEENIIKEMNLVNEINQPVKLSEINSNKVFNSKKILIELKDLGVYKLKEKVSKLFNKKTETKTNIFIELWKYVHNKKIIRNGKIHCNEELKDILEVDKINIEEVKLIDLIEPLDLVEIETYPEIYDIEVEMDDLVDFPVLYQSHKIPQLNTKINEMNEIIGMVKERINVLTEFISKGESYVDENCINDKRSFFYDPLVQEKVLNLIQHMK